MTIQTEPGGAAEVRRGFGPWTEDLTEAERLARLRSMRALATVFLGPNHEFTSTLAAAENDPAAARRALEDLDRLAALPRRRILAVYAEIARQQPRGAAA